MALSATIGFIGAGNMARALIGGLLRAGVRSDQIFIHDAKAEAIDALCHSHQVSRLAGAAQPVDVLILAVKPIDAQSALTASRSYLHAATVVLSIAAGIPLRALAKWCPSDTALVRAMPNTPALIGKGITAVYAAPSVTQAQRDTARTILKAAGEVVWVETEQQLDAVTAVSGSGPAYLFFLIEAMEQAALAEGLPPQTARRLALATCAGAAELAMQSDLAPAALREQVTSKGGTTYAALQSLAHDGFAEAIARAIRAATERAAQMGEEYGAN